MTSRCLRSTTANTLAPTLSCKSSSTSTNPGLKLIWSISLFRRTYTPAVTTPTSTKDAVSAVHPMSSVPTPHGTEKLRFAPAIASDDADVDADDDVTIVDFIPLTRRDSLLSVSSASEGTGGGGGGGGSDDDRRTPSRVRLILHHLRVHSRVTILLFCVFILGDVSTAIAFMVTAQAFTPPARIPRAPRVIQVHLSRVYFNSNSRRFPRVSAQYSLPRPRRCSASYPLRTERARGLSSSYSKSSKREREDLLKIQ